MGLKVVAVSDSKGAIYNPNGLSYDKVKEHKLRTRSVVGFPGSETISGEDLWRVDVEVLIPAALEGMVTESNASDIKAKVILELANGPTTPEAEAILSDKGVLILPDVLANAGGVIVSYFEWVQGRTGDYWSEKMVQERLEERIVQSFRDIWAIKNNYKIRMRQAAYVQAIGRIASAMRFRGIWP
jgi:glutamate dehydrogenase/leucine dehydrogenase